MSAKQKVCDFLTANPGQSYCDDCLSTILAIRPRQQVQQKTSALAKDARFRRSFGRCSRCAHDKLVVAARVVSLVG